MASLVATGSCLPLKKKKVLTTPVYMKCSALNRTGANSQELADEQSEAFSNQRVCDSTQEMVGTKNRATRERILDTNTTPN